MKGSWGERAVPIIVCFSRLCHSQMGQLLVNRKVPFSERTRNLASQVRMTLHFFHPEPIIQHQGTRTLVWMLESTRVHHHHLAEHQGSTLGPCIAGFNSLTH